MRADTALMLAIAEEDDATARYQKARTRKASRSGGIARPNQDDVCHSAPMPRSQGAYASPLIVGQLRAKSKHT